MDPCRHMIWAESICKVDGEADWHFVDERVQHARLGNEPSVQERQSTLRSGKKKRRATNVSHV